MPLDRAAIVFAQSDIFRNLGSGFRGRAAQFHASDLIAVIAVVVAIGVGLYFLSRWMQRNEQPQRTNNPRGLFRELCRAHELDRTTRRLLQQIARHQQLSHAARLFLEPERFEPANLSPDLRARQSEVAALRERLFAGLLTAAPAKEPTGGTKAKSVAAPVVTSPPPVDSPITS